MRNHILKRAEEVPSCKLRNESCLMNYSLNIHQTMVLPVVEISKSEFLFNSSDASQMIWLLQLNRIEFLPPGARPVISIAEKAVAIESTFLLFRGNAWHSSTIDTECGSGDSLICFFVSSTEEQS